MLLKFKFFIALFLILKYSTALSYSGGSGVALFTGKNKATTTVKESSGDTRFTANDGNIFGASYFFTFTPFIVFPFSPLRLKVEFGAFKIKRDYEAARTRNQHEMYQIPLLVRLFPFEGITIFGGGYYARATGQVTIKNSDIGTSVEQSYEDSNLAKHEFGFIYGVGAYIPLFGAKRVAEKKINKLGILVELRMTEALTNSSTIEGVEMKFQDQQLLAGLLMEF